MWIDRYWEGGPEALKSRHRGGLHLRKTTAEEDGDIRRTATQNPFITATQIREQLNLEVSDSTVRQRLRDSGLNARKPASKPALDPAHAEARLEYCQENLHRDWSRVIFSDEKTFSTSTDVRTYVWRPPGSRYDMDYVRPDSASGRISAGFWGYMTSLGPGQVIRVSPPRFTAARYVEVRFFNLFTSVPISGVEKPARIKISPHIKNIIS